MGKTKTYPRFFKQEIDSRTTLGVWAIFPDGREAGIGTIKYTKCRVAFQARARALYDSQRHFWEKEQ